MRTFFFLLCISLGLKGQAPSFKRLSEGLTHQHITSLLRSSEGLMWIGTPAGLHRYDGNSIRVYSAGGPYGIKDNAITHLFEGPKNHLWIRAGSRLSVLDVRHERFIHNSDSLLIGMGMKAGNLLDIKKDEAGKFWFLYTDGSLFRYSPGKTLVYRSRQNAQITGIALDRKQGLWVVLDTGCMEKVNTVSLEPILTQCLNVQRSEEYRIFVDAQGSPWIYQANAPAGIYWWPDKEPLHFHVQSPQFPLNNNAVMGVTQDSHGRIWIATDHGGINLFDPKNRSISYSVYEEFNERSLSHNGTSTLLCDSEGIVWVGTYKGGVNYYHEQLVQFPHVRHRINQKNSLPFEDVNRFVEDKDGNLWIGTNGGGLIFYDKRSQNYRQYLHSPSDPRSLGSNVVVSLCLDREGVLWVGTYHGGLNRFENGKFQRFVHRPDDNQSLRNNSVWEIFEDREGRLWIGTLAGGLHLMNKKEGTFLRISEGPSANYICAIMEDREGALWLGSANGIEVWKPFSKEVRQYTAAQGLNNEYISDILQDSKGQIWVATRNGLHLYSAGNFKALKYDHLDPTVHTLLEDKTGKIWLSTAKGVSVLSPYGNDDWTVRNFDTHDGLQAASFNENAALKLKNGELLFGGPLGFNRIRPEELGQVAHLPQPVIVDFMLFNRSVAVGESIDGKVLLRKSILYTDHVTLKYDQNVVSLQLSSRYFLHPERVRIKYILEGFSKEWLEVDSKSNIITFTNLSAGDYELRVMASADGEKWTEEKVLLTLSVRPPWWQSIWAFSAYALVLVLALLGIRYFERRKQMRRFALQQEREEARRLKELDQLKTKFFTNVSHEFRTPLSLIISPIEKLAKQEEEESKRIHLDLVHRNAKRLLNLVNQLLDFRKIDTRSLHLQNVEGDVLVQIRDFALSFRDLAEAKEIVYTVDIPQQATICAFDHDKLERIVFNLLSNAFKFTPVGGRVDFQAKLLHHELYLQVADSGIGISDEAQAKIFERYFQDDLLQAVLNQGSGIGLSIVKEYLHLMGGKIEVASELGKGSTFQVHIPLGLSGTHHPKTEKRGALGRQKILVVEDNEDFRFYLMDNLRETYAVEEARNAEEAWEKSLSFHPDMIVTDVNMPGDTGIAFCKKIKADSRTMHIPVILLTALSSAAVQLEGIEAGAADYIVKPFNVELLLSKIRSHLKQKSSLEKTFKKQVSVDAKTTGLESLDEKFIRKALEVVEKNIGNPLFSVEALSEEMSVSRVGLYKKVFHLTGSSPSEFIRQIRLKRAAQLLEETGLTVSEISYEVGFNNPKVFSRYFRDFWGMLPTDYRKNKGK
jgi:signal transduction histidine kinase/ligand-binding sensor domain-containing protein/AraC-like DNA-binding protein